MSEFEDAEYAEYLAAGGWLSITASLVRWLSFTACYEHLHLLERDVRSVSGVAPPHIEKAALESICQSLSHICDSPPTNLTQEQKKELNRLRREATRFVQYRLRELASDKAVKEQATRAVSQWLAEANDAGCNSIERIGPNWMIQFGDERVAFASNAFGALEIVAKLVATPNCAVDFKEFEDPATRAFLEMPVTTAEILDKPAVSELRQRYADLQKQDNPSKKNENDEEMSQIAAALRTATGFGGRKRKLGKTPADQAWDAMRKRLERLWPRLRDQGMPTFSAHMEGAIEMKLPYLTYKLPKNALPWNTGA